MNRSKLTLLKIGFTSIAGIVALTSIAATKQPDVPVKSTNAADSGRLNFLFITADDMNWDSPGCYGGTVPNITPNIDRLSREGVKFTHAYVTAGSCTPSRMSLLTGLYPHNNGGEGFEPIDPKVTTLTEILHNNGYLNGIMGKEDHPQPVGKFYWDYYIRTVKDLEHGRSPQKYYQFAKQFFERAKKSGQPFFLMANSNDPHRPFAGDFMEQNKLLQGKGGIPYSRKILSAEITLPPFLPDIQDQKDEMAAYFTSVFRCDETVGMLLKALAESEMEENTIVMFISDNGMAFPFAKETCLPNGVRTPWIVRCPGKIKAGTVNNNNVISGVDFAPTVLDMAGIKTDNKFDGKSILPILENPDLVDREFAFSEFHETGGYDWHPDYVTMPIRAIHGKRYHYIINFWSNGQRTVKGSWAEDGWFRHYITDVLINSNKESLNLYYRSFHQAPRQFFDTQTDPNCMINLIGKPEYLELIEQYHAMLLKHLKESNDPAYKALKKNTEESFDAFYNYQYEKSKDRDRIKEINMAWPLIEK